MPPQPLKAYLISDGGLRNAFIIEEPNDLRKGRPELIGSVYKGFLFILFDERNVSIWKEKLLNG
jgi:hypothetical protein